MRPFPTVPPMSSGRANVACRGPHTSHSRELKETGATHRFRCLHEPRRGCEPALHNALATLTQSPANGPSVSSLLPLLTVKTVGSSLETRSERCPLTPTPPSAPPARAPWNWAKSAGLRRPDSEYAHAPLGWPCSLSLRRSRMGGHATDAFALSADRILSRPPQSRRPEVRGSATTIAQLLQAT